MPTSATVRAQILRCHKVIRTYGDDLLESNLIDLLADTMHWCRQHGISFDHVSRLARMHFNAETRPPLREGSIRDSI